MASAPLPRQTLLTALVLAAVLVFAARMASERLFPLPVVRTPQVADQAAREALAMAQAEESRQAQLRQDRMAREQALIEQDRQRRERNLQAALAAREQADAFDRIERERKEQAWQRFYVVPRKCRNATDPGVTAECNNHFAREQQRFEKQWEAGKLDKP